MKKIIKKLTLDYSKISNLEVDGIDMSDYPDFCDSFISYAEYDGIEMTEAELDVLNKDSDFIYNAVEQYLY